MLYPLESSAPAPRVPGRTWYHPLKAVLTAIGNGLQALLLPSNEPVICQHLDRQGRCYWVAYDPRSGQDFWFETELEVLQWLETLPYQ